MAAVSIDSAALELVPRVYEAAVHPEAWGPWLEDLARWGEFFRFQRETPKARSSYFGFPMTVKETAPFQVRELMASGQLGSISIGRIRLVPLSAIDAFLERKLAER